VESPDRVIARSGPEANSASRFLLPGTGVRAIGPSLMARASSLILSHKRAGIGYLRVLLPGPWLLTAVAIANALGIGTSASSFVDILAAVIPRVREPPRANRTTGASSMPESNRSVPLNSGKRRETGLDTVPESD